MTEFEKLKAWYEAQKAKGMKGFHVTTSNMLGFSEKVFDDPAPYVAMLPEGVTLEQVCKEMNEVNEMIASGKYKTVERGDIF